MASIASLVRPVSDRLWSSLARARGRPALHPDGVLLEARVELWSGAPSGVGAPGTTTTFARLSRSFGFPQPVPDLLGLAVRLPATDLIVNRVAADAPVLQHAMWLYRSFAHGDFTSVLPYRLDGELIVLGASAVPPRDADEGPGSDLERAVRLAQRGQLSYLLRHAPVPGRLGPPWGRVDLGAPLPGDDADAPRTNPWRTGPGLEPAGPLNDLRRSAYERSQAARCGSREVANRSGA